MRDHVALRPRRVVPQRSRILVECDDGNVPSFVYVPFDFGGRSVLDRGLVLDRSSPADLLAPTSVRSMTTQSLDGLVH